MSKTPKYAWCTRDKGDCHKCGNAVCCGCLPLNECCDYCFKVRTARKAVHGRRKNAR